MPPVRNDPHGNDPDAWAALESVPLFTISADHVILAIQLEQAPKFIFQIVSLAAQHELVCFDPQAGKVYLPPGLEAKPPTWPQASARVTGHLGEG